MRYPAPRSRVSGRIWTLVSSAFTTDTSEITLRVRARRPPTLAHLSTALHKVVVDRRVRRDPSETL